MAFSFFLAVPGLVAQEFEGDLFDDWYSYPFTPRQDEQVQPDHTANPPAGQSANPADAGAPPADRFPSSVTGGGTLPSPPSGGDRSGFEQRGVDRLDPYRTDRAADPYDPSYNPYGGGFNDRPSAMPAPAGPQTDFQKNNYSGYYAVGDDLYYYDMTTGRFMLTAKGAAKTKPGDIDVHGDLVATRGVDKPPLITLAVGEAQTCGRWKHALSGTREFVGSLECTTDLEERVEAALIKVGQEGELLARRLRKTPQAEGFGGYDAMVKITRPRLTNALQKYLDHGCACTPRQ